MALTRTMLKGMGLTEEQIGSIIEEHTNVTSSLKTERDKYKEDADKLPAVQKELDKLKADTSASDWEEKYNTEHKAFEEYKEDITAKEKSAQLKSAYRKMLAECNINEKHLDAILKVTDFSQMKLNENGEFDNAEDLKKAITTDWSEFIPTMGTKGADVDNPPEGDHHEDGNIGRAAELAASYHDKHYGKTKED